MTAIRKFNSYCEQLESHYDVSSGIPLPSPLPTKLADLRADHTLMEDVWITPSVGEVPQWLEDHKVRDGIRVLLKHDHCQEQLRLRTKADNSCRFFCEEFAALQLALRRSESMYYYMEIQPSFSDVKYAGDHFTAILQQRHSNFLHTQSRWTNPLVSSAQFTTQVDTA
jgi:hypothetical protein